MNASSRRCCQKKFVTGHPSITHKHETGLPKWVENAQLHGHWRTQLPREIPTHHQWIENQMPLCNQTRCDRQTRAHQQIPDPEMQCFAKETHHDHPTATRWQLWHMNQQPIQQTTIKRRRNPIHAWIQFQSQEHKPNGFPAQLRVHIKNQQSWPWTTGRY